ncbi:hypothetical protein AB0C10_36185 [Microbispora amethystogenes]|uniref:hypothetical protein n=1 Tax=Microbispora amethystogenes TaxID=1427754 RepID=UPI0033E064AF
MAKARDASTPGSRMWRWVTVAAIVALVGLLAVGLVAFFADPLHLPSRLLGVLDQRASVVSMFIGAAGLVVAVAALLLQVRADGRQAVSPASAASAEPRRTDGSPTRPVAYGGEQRRYGGDHVEFHHNTFGGTVIGKQVTGPTPPMHLPADGTGDDQE